MDPVCYLTVILPQKLRLKTISCHLLFNLFITILLFTWYILVLEHNATSIENTAKVKLSIFQ